MIPVDFLLAFGIVLYVYGIFVALAVEHQNYARSIRSLILFALCWPITLFNED